MYYTEAMTNFTAMLTPSRGRGSWRTWTGDAVDWDDACEWAAAANPGWDVHTCGETVEGAMA